MNDLTAPDTNDDVNDDIPPAALAARERRFANRLCVWRLCGRIACRRAHECRRDPVECVARCAPLIPEAARNFADLAYEAEQKGGTFEDAVHRYRNEWDAFQNWHYAVVHSL